MQTQLAGAILKPRPDVFFVRSATDVWLRNNVGSFFIKGEGAYELVRALFARFDGSRTVAEVCSEFPQAQRALICERLLAPIVAKGFLRVVRPEPEPEPSWIAERYAEQIAFLEQYVERPIERWQAIRQQPVACAGSGPLLRAISVALADLGFGRVQVRAADSDSDAARLSEVIAAAAELDPRARWDLAFHRQPVQLAELVALSSDAVAVVLAGDAERCDVMAADALLRARGQITAVIAPVGDLLAASPLLDGDDACWECMHRAIVSGAACPPAPPSAALAAFQLAQRLFCRLAGPEVPDDRELTTIDMRTLTVRCHQPRRHPACPRHGTPVVRAIGLHLNSAPARVRPDLPSSTDDAESIALQDSIVRVVSSWTDAVVGPLRFVGEDDLLQLPLSASLCRLQAAADTAASSPVQNVVCRAVSAREARNQAVLFGLEWLAEAHLRSGTELPHTWLAGAGFSRLEAVFRAMASSSLLASASGRCTAIRRIDSIPWAPASTRRFLLESLTDRTGFGLELVLELAPTGLSCARVEQRGRILGRGAGLTEEQAIDHALTDALARTFDERATAQLVRTAYSNPAARCWDEVLPAVWEVAQRHYALWDLAEALPWLEAKVNVVALAPVGNASGEALA